MADKKFFLIAEGDVFKFDSPTELLDGLGKMDPADSEVTVILGVMCDVAKNFSGVRTPDGVFLSQTRWATDFNGPADEGDETAENEEESDSA